MQDKQIVELYWERSESAIAETEKKYGRYCQYIAGQILENDEDAKEIVNDTYLKTWQTIPPKRPESLKAYVGMICRQLAFNLYEKQHTKKRGQVPLVIKRWIMKQLSFDYLIVVHCSIVVIAYILKDFMIWIKSLDNRFAIFTTSSATSCNLC